MKQVLDYLMSRLGKEYSVSEATHDSFIEGRTGKISLKLKSKEIGIIGEIHPKVLSSWNMEMPCCVLELELSELEN